MLTAPRRSAIVGCALGLAAVTSCTAVPPDGERTTPTPPAVHTAELRLPQSPATVVTAADAVTRAAAVSEALFVSSPVAVVARASDVAAQVRAASIAVALGAPLLLVPDAGATPPPTTSTPAASDPTTTELRRLDVLGVVSVGGAQVDVAEDVTVVEAPVDPGALAEAVGIPLPPAAVEGSEVEAVAALDRNDPVLLGAGTPSSTAPPTTTPTITPTLRPTATPASTPISTEPSSPALPLTELAEPLDGGLVLTTGAPEDLAAVATARAAGIDVLTVPTGDPRAASATVQAFAAAKPAAVIGLGPAFGSDQDLTWKAATASTGVELPGGGQVLFPGRRFVAMYGVPQFPALGILGEQDVPTSIARAKDLAVQYQALTGDVVVPAFEIIVTVASAGAGPDGNYSNELPADSFVPWVEAARDAGVYVVLDLQPGRTDFLTQARMYEPLLAYPNVGLALDPEWRLAPDQTHLRQIGSVGIDEVNAVGDYLAELTRTNALPQKLFMLHQFMPRMIQGRENLDTTHPEISVLIHADGQGSQGGKAGTWQALHQGAPEGVTWGWKNFIDEDSPVLTPEQTYQVQPPPAFVSYQ